jgi:hypothetical protein
LVATALVDLLVHTAMDPQRRELDERRRGASLTLRRYAIRLHR